MIIKQMPPCSHRTITDLINMLCAEYGPEAAQDMMVENCLDSPSKDIQKKGMEYLYMHGYFPELKQLIQKNRQSDDPSNRLWGTIYHIMIRQTLREISPHKTIQLLQHFRERYSTKEPELLFLIDLIRENAYYQMPQYDRIGKIMVTHQQYFALMEDRSMVSYFKIRVYKINVIYHLMRNELIMARKYAYRVLNSLDSPLIHAGIHLLLGISYTFDTYEKGMYHLKKSFELAKEVKLNYLTESLKNFYIPFLSAHFKKVDNITTKDRGEQAHIELAKGNHAKVIEILDHLPEKDAFQLYYLGKAKEDKSLLIKSYNHFIEKRSDYFFCRLPINAFKEM
ncbi:AimR family lysis-lysogeny pheromone receptor [Oceanobacillus massiliensis]|uniref:AimR family lysis-lysogeny pheromone receptor n=1 Tax=Oceanobacillus massiliensis TaxID=1465765 RepID=UPI0002899DF9|nr:AimR family lysis-lysogeny pheromone receptor [Oceanobacillus massiliensis]